MHHLEVWALEGESEEDQNWMAWIARAEKMAGQSIDGDQETDGYSLDYAYGAFERGETPREYLYSERW